MERDLCSKSGIMPVGGLSHTPLTSDSARWRERDHCSKSGIMPVGGLSHTPLTSHSARWRERDHCSKSGIMYYASWWTVTHTSYFTQCQMERDHCSKSGIMPVGGLSHTPLTSHSARWRERDHCSKSDIMPVGGLSHAPLTSDSARWRETTALNSVLCQLVDCHTHLLLQTVPDGERCSKSGIMPVGGLSQMERDLCSKSGIMPVSGLSHAPHTSDSARWRERETTALNPVLCQLVDCHTHLLLQTVPDGERERPLL